MGIPKENASTNLALKISVFLQSHWNSAQVNHYRYD